MEQIGWPEATALCVFFVVYAAAIYDTLKYRGKG